MSGTSISSRIASFVSEKFEQKANEGKEFCVLMLIGEPEFSSDILLDEEM